ncbi:MAG: hypothetical protein A2358_01655 [Candidatus Staskawiczbacteria bacterium RIFOXYB1_FULL_37_44]|uniref:Transcriptional repressor PaaX-like central Cas2-like domain-containing protein n=1 Tax=Candidatus Staskawiczbacteria bacterium RIFOXYB1_FULL_37_44 TaxID=1802223 RepID=A0A1G2IZ75_9BACT|nr:MAG: hypothetical protein A2358_01655 [Candidatus Staskawiczbacteria bacterium RIFOXYB1_FULL_37_44]OGZ83411.1 MAG: hypothetical protein A2416_02390 [Candidatus Staskawiczbacteria bacterium RIFOXYC1_FULL_37_52]OGZ88234.1 MAG: hypothetical protein A2444_00410 [Candidatus Staskawiczbacteria bacterium RIFOXYC2_FULL_37_19]OGZ88814.1 MAG: hypothetical protein A2581_03330 [Candidatus Staskawiczbacteria bacterium RIFOXYD1_FULL_37_110]
MSRIKNKEPLPEKVLKFIGGKSLEFLDLSFKLVFDPEEMIKNYGFIFSYAPRVIYNLKKSPYFSQQGGKFYVTEKGRMRIIKNIIRSKNNQFKRLSGSWLGIIFDIPEANRRERAFLRRELDMAGCKELQKSVWVTPFDIEKELLALMSLWKKDFKGDIRFLKIDKISGEEEIKKYFKIF